MGAGTALAQAAGTARKRQSGQTPLCGAADLPGMWECVHSYDSLLEWQEPGGICVPRVSPEWKVLLLLPRIREEVLDAEVQAGAETVREQCAVELKKLAHLQKMWALRKPILDAHISSLQKRIRELEQEIDEIVMERIVTLHWPR